MSKKSKILLSLVNMLIIPVIVFAEDDESYNIMANVLNAILNALSWIGYAIALGILIWIGIKYMLSGANERANLKGSVSMYLIGIALIVMCSTIAGGVAELASKNGDNTAGGIVNKGFELGGIVVGDRTGKDEKTTPTPTPTPTMLPIIQSPDFVPPISNPFDEIKDALLGKNEEEPKGQRIPFNEVNWGTVPGFDNILTGERDEAELVEFATYYDDVFKVDVTVYRLKTIDEMQDEKNNTEKEESTEKEGSTGNINFDINNLKPADFDGVTRYRGTYEFQGNTFVVSVPITDTTKIFGESTKDSK